jgi:MoaA/NifB/PqqE/SkfB family radical SAM enzyme
LSAHAFVPQLNLRRLPLAILYVTDRCNSRCVTCDYWRHGRDSMTLESVARLLPSFDRLETKTVLISGGEPLLNPEWRAIAGLLHAHGLKLWLLTSGLSLVKHAREAAEYFENITVSLDGTDAATYSAIRGVNAFDKVCEGIRKAADCGVAPGTRVTLQRANFRQLPSFVELTKSLGASSISFLAVDVANPHAFGRSEGFQGDLALRREDLPIFAALLENLERQRPEDFSSGFIAESPRKLRRILQYFAAIQHQAAYPPVRCNAPEFSAVIGATGRVQPCFFISGPTGGHLPSTAADSKLDFADTLNTDRMAALREDIRSGKRGECKTCVCSMWRDSASFTSLAV